MGPPHLWQGSELRCGGGVAMRGGGEGEPVVVVVVVGVQVWW